ncbi:glycine cleavage system T protein [Delitschia confertaspora ATCC 74209]|uniref:Aminomethyltransferase n=1 Tax=Delitschia confertaspora ATCC 74209 TaxID=1513339 RepID=A0A9P4JP97_9PLEO|nr:glycine cleavage system T protein [Delitschia confertaspora ATCC 74209]
MASKRSVVMLKPALKPTAPRCLRANCSSMSASRPLSTVRSTRPFPAGTILRTNIRYSSSSTNTENLGRTPLYDLHAKYGAKFVPFGGYNMPVQYSDLSIGESHHWTREKASLFDVGHMVQHEFSGPGAEAFLSQITPTSFKSLKPHSSTLSALLHRETGGIVDDTVIMRLTDDMFYVVTNAGCREKDLAYFTSELKSWKDSGKPEVKWDVLEGKGLIALQGPSSATILSGVLDSDSASKLDSLYFGQSMYGKIKLNNGSLSPSLLISRGGYTGEDGFEISIPASATTAVTSTLLDSAKETLRFAGLGARDTLRLEAGMCLYGHDLDDTTTPVEGALSWIIGKDRRVEGGFHGSSVILQQLKKKSEGGGVSRRRVGLIIEGAPAREGAEIVDESGEKIGRITSGCPSPTLKKNIAMGYIQDGMHKSGTEVQVVVRGKKRKATVTKLPFVPSGAVRRPKGVDGI